MKKLLALLAFGAIAVSVTEISASNLNTAPANTDTANQEERTFFEAVEDAFRGVELPTNWGLMDFFGHKNDWDVKNIYKDCTFWTILALAKEFQGINIDEFDSCGRELISDIREFVVNRSRHKSGAWSITSGYEISLQVLFDHLVKNYLGAQDNLTLTKITDFATKKQLKDILRIAHKVKECIFRVHHSEAVTESAFDSVVRDIPTDEEKISGWFGNLDQGFKNKYTGYKGIAFWTLALLAKQFGNDEYKGDEKALIDRVKHYAKYEFLHEEPKYCNLKGRNWDLLLDDEELVTRAELFFSGLIFRYADKEAVETLKGIYKKDKELDGNDLQVIIKLSKSIKENILNRYQTACIDNSINKAIGKVMCGIDIGTGTVIKYTDMPSILNDRVVLTAYHCLDETGASDLKYTQTAGTITTYKNVTFEGQKIKAVHMDREKDIGIAILFEKSAKESFSIAPSSVLEDWKKFEKTKKEAEEAKNNEKKEEAKKVESNGKTKEESFGNFYTIGYGGDRSMDNIELGKRKATTIGTISEFYDNGRYCSVGDNRLRILGGDSGSAVLRKNKDSEEIIGIITQGSESLSSGPYLDQKVFTWIKAVCDQAAKAEEDEENAITTKTRAKHVERTNSLSE